MTKRPLNKIFVEFKLRHELLFASIKFLFLHNGLKKLLLKILPLKKHGNHEQLRSNIKFN